jgi:hypothetical protein
MMDNRSQIGKIIACLEDVLKRPEMYLGPSADVTHVVAFLSGFDTACTTLGLSSGHMDTAYQSVVREKGWAESSTRGIWNIMSDRGITEHEIVRELIVIEIEAWKQRAASPLSN